MLQSVLGKERTWNRGVTGTAWVAGGGAIRTKEVAWVAGGGAIRAKVLNEQLRR